MRVFVTGATGFIGSAVVDTLIKAGHEVAGLARSDASAAALSATGANVVRGSLDDLEGLHNAAAASDGVIHTAHNHDFETVGRDIAAAQDLAGIKAMGAAVVGTNRPLIITSATAAPTEDDDGDPNYPRYLSEQATLSMAKDGVRSMVVRLPPTVHGAGDKSGFMPRLISLARSKGVSAWIDNGLNCWPSVHRLDAAQLYLLALENGSARSRFHAVQEEGVQTKKIAEAIGRRLKVPAVSLPPADAAEHFGFLGHIIAMDIHASSHATQDQLGWQPTQPRLIEDVEGQAYADS